MHSAGQPSFTEISHDTIEFTVGFHNAGMMLKDVGGKRWTSKVQARNNDTVGAFTENALNMLCLSELGEFDAGLAGKLETSGAQWMQDVLSETIVSQATVYAHAHYATIIKKDDFAEVTYGFIRDFIPKQDDRPFQHARVRLHGQDKLVPIVNCHAPMSKKRKLTDMVRSTYLAAFCKSSGECSSFWGGDFNTDRNKVADLLDMLDGRHSPLISGGSIRITCREIRSRSQ